MRPTSQCVSRFSCLLDRCHSACWFQVLFYIEMNLGPEALNGKPGVTNDVVPKVKMLTARML